MTTRCIYIYKVVDHHQRSLNVNKIFIVFNAKKGLKTTIKKQRMNIEICFPHYVTTVCDRQRTLALPCNADIEKQK